MMDRYARTVFLFRMGIVVFDPNFCRFDYFHGVPPFAIGFDMRSEPNVIL
jgi:hypothetical protein